MTAQDQQSRAELLPCPFCGGAASAHEVDPRGAPGWFHLTVRHRDGCLHRPSKEILLLNADDLERWNRRAPAEQAARALPTSMKPVAEIFAGDLFRVNQGADAEPVTGDHDLYTAAQVLAMGRVPPEWQAVPVELTREMGDAYLKADGRFHSARSDWAAMLAAAPRPPAAQEGA